jgi:hypothetical protein
MRLGMSQLLKATLHYVKDHQGDLIPMFSVSTYQPNPFVRQPKSWVRPSHMREVKRRVKEYQIGPYHIITGGYTKGMHYKCVNGVGNRIYDSSEAAKKLRQWRRKYGKHRIVTKDAPWQHWPIKIKKPYLRSGN